MKTNRIPWPYFAFFLLLVVGQSVSAQTYSVQRVNNRAGNWIDITRNGVRLNPGDDRNQPGIPIGFNFRFYGRSFNRINISPNGWVSFSSTSDQYEPQEIPGTGMPENLIAPYFYDLDFRSSGSLYYRRDANRFIISWVNAQEYPTRGGPITFQVQLYRTGTIVFMYRNMMPSSSDHWGAGVTVGIQNTSRTQGVQVYRGAKNGAQAPRNAQMITFVPGGVTSPLQRLPDLVIERISLDPPRPAPGQLIRASVTVRNRGNAPSGGGILEVWSDRATPTAMGQQGDGAVRIGRLGPGQWQQLRFTLAQGVRAPDSGGDYIFRAVADNVNAIRESNENNNARTVQYQVVPVYSGENDEFEVLFARRGGVRYRRIEVPRDQSRLVARTRPRPANHSSPGTGDADIYLKRGSVPTPTDYNWKSNRRGTSDEWVVVNNPDPISTFFNRNPAAGIYFAKIHARTDFDNILYKSVYYRNRTHWFQNVTSSLEGLFDNFSASVDGASVLVIGDHLVDPDTYAFTALQTDLAQLHHIGEHADLIKYVIQLAKIAAQRVNVEDASNEIEYAVEYNQYVRDRVMFVANLVATKSGAAKSAVLSAKVGTLAGPKGTVIGATLGGIVGGITGGITSSIVVGGFYDDHVASPLRTFSESVYNDQPLYIRLLYNSF